MFAVEAIIKQSVDELVRVGLVEAYRAGDGIDQVVVEAVEREVSGRGLRKLCFLALVEVGGQGRLVSGSELVKGMKIVLASM